MRTHKYKTSKFPVGDQVIYHFGKLLFDNIESDFWIAGGAITSFLSKEKINDIDCFVKSRNDAAKLCKELRNKFEFKPYMITIHAIKGIIKIKNISLKIDIVKRELSHPISTIEMFDFTVTCFAVDKDKFYYLPNAAFDLLRKKIVIHNLTHPVDSMRRLQKYIRRGFTACNGTILEIAEAIRKLSDDQMEIVEFYPVD